MKVKIEVKNAKQLKEKIERRTSGIYDQFREQIMKGSADLCTGELVTAALWNGDIVSNGIAIGNIGPELMTPAPVRKAGDVIVECEYCAQLNLLVPERAHKGCGACGGMLNLDLVVEEDDQVKEWRNPAAGGKREAGGSWRGDGTRSLTFRDFERATRELQVAIGSSLLPSVKAATDACNKLGRAVAGNQAHA